MKPHFILRIAREKRLFSSSGSTEVGKGGNVTLGNGGTDNSLEGEVGGEKTLSSHSGARMYLLKLTVIYSLLTILLIELPSLLTGLAAN